MKKLFILDAMALAHRCYHVHKELKTSDGRLTGVAYGTATFIENLLKQQHPDYFLVVTDVKGKTFRHEMYKEYKANRGPHDEDFIKSLPLFFEYFKTLGVRVTAMEGFEADDVIGSVCRKFPDVLKVIVSSDKDFMQLLDGNTIMYKPKKWPDYEIVGPQQVVEKLGVLPSQVVDYLSITGDSSDNVPGVKGIGEKGASELLKSFGTLAGVYRNVDLIKGKNSEKLKSSRDNAFLSQKLVEIKTDLPLNVMLEDLVVSEDLLRSDKIQQFYKDLEFNSFL